MSSSKYKDWDDVYRNYPAEALPWELGKPRKTLIDLIENGRIQPGSALDACCGLGTNTVYMAQKGFNVTAIDISKHALKRAQQKARRAKAEIEFVLASFVMLPFKDAAFNFVFDMGCFHHVEVEDRPEFIKGVRRALRPDSKYLLVCFSDKNGRAWNHFTKEQIAQYFSREFKLASLDHFGSVEGDGYTRFFYSVLMQPRTRPSM
jgi:ubiquinone/menaquinone biosynthesis C-methylase UbiE